MTRPRGVRAYRFGQVDQEMGRPRQTAKGNNGGRAAVQQAAPPANNEVTAALDAAWASYRADNPERPLTGIKIIDPNYSQT